MMTTESASYQLLIIDEKINLASIFGKEDTW